MGFPFYPVGVSSTTRQCLLQKKACFLERRTGITEVSFGRTELSLRLSWIEFCTLLRREGPEGPGVQGMPEKFDVHDFFDFFVEQI